MAEQLKTDQDIISKFNQLRQDVNTIWTKISELESDAAECELVIKNLEPMEPTRKAFRLINDVLVERTVGEVLPAVKKQKENLDNTIESYKKGFQQKQQELSEFQTKYKIKIKTQDDLDEEEPQQPSRAATAGQGVLVSKK
jgi:prefoldin subunit 2